MLLDIMSYLINLSSIAGNATAQAVHLCMSTPFIASGQQSFAVPSHIPISQPSFPVFHPIPVRGSNGFLGSKFL